MEWKMIETKWEAMTRRIRADYPIDRLKTFATSSRNAARNDALSVPPADNMTAAAQGSEFKSSSK